MEEESKNNRRVRGEKGGKQKLYPLEEKKNARIIGDKRRK